LVVRTKPEENEKKNTEKAANNRHTKISFFCGGFEENLQKKFFL
jgi:hypothetical protein